MLLVASGVLTGPGQFREAWPYISGTDPAWEPTYRQIQSHKYMFTSISGFNFPLGGICVFSQNRDQVIQSIPPQQVVHRLVRAHLQAFEPIYRLFHPPQLEEELNAFWADNTSCAEEWLAQLFMVLALGSHTTPEPILRGTGPLMESCTARFLDAAQFCFSRSPYLSAPTLTSVRILCLTVIARLLEVKGAETSQLLSLTGFLTRTAMAINLHRAPSVLSGVTAFEAEMRRRVWTTVQLLDLQVAIRTGTSYAHKNEDTIVPLNINNTDIYRTHHGWMLRRQQAQRQGITDSTFQVQLAELLPTLIQIVNTINSPTKGPPTYEKVQSWDSQLRQKLQDAETALTPNPQRSTESQVASQTQLDFLRLIIHRTLLGLHHHSLTTPASQHPESTSAITQSALEILCIQQAWHSQQLNRPQANLTPSLNPNSSIATFSFANTPILSPPPPYSSSTVEPPPPDPGWLLSLHRDTFTAALLYRTSSKVHVDTYFLDNPLSTLVLQPTPNSARANLSV
jgi:hypothetical protein